MLLNFEIENWTCFRNRTSFTMQAGSERDPDGRIAKIGAPSRPLKVLPLAAIYGNNASGKTRFVTALSFLRDLVLEEYKTGVLPVFPFLLDDESAKSPTHFNLQFVIHEEVYELDVVLTDSSILKESLAKYNSRTTSKAFIYEREGQSVKSCAWGGDAFCKFVNTMTVDPTRLFLTLSSIFAGQDPLVASIFGWFASSLVLITPGSHYLGVDDCCADGSMDAKTRDYLSRFDTGISRLEAPLVSLDTFRPQLIDDLRRTLKPGTCTRRLVGKELYLFAFDGKKELTAKRVTALHAKTSGGDMPFPMAFESDGTRRMLDFIPAISRLSEPNQEIVFVVDEIDRNLHHLVTRALIEDFLMTCNAKTRAQLIFTTHDLLLMDQDLCRRDEMWVTDKDPEGKSTLTDFASFKGLRKDTKIRDVYLDGRLGGIPRHI